MKIKNKIKMICFEVGLWFRTGSVKRRGGVVISALEFTSEGYSTLSHPANCINGYLRQNPGGNPAID